jgi:hypothetical protein
MISKILLALLLLLSVVPAFAVGLTTLLYGSPSDGLLYTKTMCFRSLPLLRNLEFRLDRFVAVPLLIGGVMYFLAAIVCILRARTK